MIRTGKHATTSIEAPTFEEALATLLALRKREEGTSSSGAMNAVRSPSPVPPAHGDARKTRS